MLSSDMEDYEIVSMDQVLGFSVAVLTESYQAQQIEEAGARLLNGDCPSVDWIDIGRNAIIGGFTLGVFTGWQGIQAGAIATLPAGNPIVGGVVGGIAGFTAGFVGGAIVGGVSAYLAQQAFPRSNSGAELHCDNPNHAIFTGSELCLDQFCNERLDGFSHFDGQDLVFGSPNTNGIIFFNGSLINFAG